MAPSANGVAKERSLECPLLRSRGTGPLEKYSDPDQWQADGQNTDNLHQNAAAPFFGDSSKSFADKEKAGRGGGDRNCIP